MDAASISFSTIENLYSGQEDAFNALLKVAVTEFSSYQTNLQNLDFTQEVETLRFLLHKIKGVTSTFQLQKLLEIINAAQSDIHHNNGATVPELKPALIQELQVVVTALAAKQISLTNAAS